MLLIILINLLTINNITANNINSYDQNGYTKLILSVMENDHKKVEQLIKDGADVNLGRNTDKLYHNINSESGKTPLMYAATFSDLKMIKMLVKNKADINKKNKTRLTALLFAIDKNAEDLVFYLYKRTKSKKSPVILAQTVKSGNLKLFDFFITKKVPLSFESKKENILTLAIKSKNIKMIKRILKHDKSLLNKATRDGEYPIMVAIKQGDYKIFRELLKYPHLNLKVKDSRNQTLLHIASKRFKTDDIIKELLDLKIDASAIDDNGKTALFYLVQRRNNQAIAYLIKKTDLKIKDKQNRNVYFYAVANYNLFRLLTVKYKAPITDKDQFNKSLLTYIIDRGDYRVLKEYEKELSSKIKFFEGENILSLAVRRANYDMVEILIKAGFDVNGDKGLVPPLFKAAELNKVDILYLLLFHKADKNLYYKGRTVWGIAEGFGYKRVLFLLRNYSF